MSLLRRWIALLRSTLLLASSLLLALPVLAGTSGTGAPESSIWNILTIQGGPGHWSFASNAGANPYSQQDGQFNLYNLPVTADGSTGWYGHAVMTGGGVAGAFLGDSAIAQVFPGGLYTHCSGQVAPSGKAERVGDHYRVSGRYSFATGSPRANWLVGGYLLHDKGEQVLDENGQPVLDRVRVGDGNAGQRKDGVQAVELQGLDDEVEAVDRLLLGAGGGGFTNP